MPQENLENQFPQSTEVPAGSLASSEIRITPKENNVFQKALEWTVTLYKPEEFRSNVKLWGSGIAVPDPVKCRLISESPSRWRVYSSVLYHTRLRIAIFYLLVSGFS
jgi:hypothetical protein